MIKHVAATVCRQNVFPVWPTSISKSLSSKPGSNKPVKISDLPRQIPRKGLAVRVNLRTKIGRFGRIVRVGGHLKHGLSQGQNRALTIVYLPSSPNSSHLHDSELLSPPRAPHDAAHVPRARDARPVARPGDGAQVLDLCVDRDLPGQASAVCQGPLSRERGTYMTVEARFRSWLEPRFR